MSVIANKIARDKARIFKAHPRQVSLKYNSIWYPAIRVAAFNESLEMTVDGYNPDTDSVFKVHFSEFKGADGKPDPAPKRNEEIRADGIDWRIRETVREGDDIKLICRKRLGK